MSRFPAAAPTSGRTLVRAVVAASAAVAVALGAVTVLAPPAGAQDAVGPCTAMATLSNGVVVNPYDPALEGTVYEIPIKGSAQYQGSVDADVSPPRPISGEVVISGPPGFGDITIDDTWVWDDPDATGVSDAGEVSWSLPSALPRGVELEVKGRHVDANGVVCEGRVLVTLEGGFFDSPLGYVALAGTLLAGAGLVASMFASGGGATPPPATAWDPAAQPGYPQQPGYPPQPGDPQQPGYPPQPGAPQQPGYPPQPGAPQQPGYPPQPGAPQPPPAAPQPPGAPPPGEPPPPPPTPGGAQ